MKRKLKEALHGLKGGLTVVMLLWMCSITASAVPEETVYTDTLSLYRSMDEAGKVGFINASGELVVPYQWRSARGFREGLAFVQDDNKKWGFIDSIGSHVIPCIWNAFLFGGFHDGLALVENDEGKAGFIDKQGTLVIPCTWRRAVDFSYMEESRIFLWRYSTCQG